MNASARQSAEWPRQFFDRYGGPLATALLCALAFYPLNWTTLVWVMLVPLAVWLMDPARPRREVCGGLLLAGTLYQLALLAPFMSVLWWGWMRGSTAELNQQLLYQRAFLGVIVGAASLWGGVLLAALGLAIRPLLRRPSLAIWVLPAAWVLGMEYAAHHTVWGFAWGLIGNRLAAYDWCRQVAACAGVFGLSFLTVLVNAVLAAWLVAVRRQAVGRGLVVSTGAALLVLAAAGGYAGHRLHRPPAAPSLRVAALQGVKPEYFLTDYTGEGFDAMYAVLLKDAIAAGADVVVLPETVWLSTLEMDPAVAHEQGVLPAQLHQSLRRVAGGRMPVVALGIDAFDQGRLYNATTFWNASGLAGTYHKQRLVPFTEYRPRVIGALAPRNQLHRWAADYTPGAGTQLVRVNGLTMGAFICQEVLYPAVVRRSVRAGAELLVTTGNDGVFASPIVAREQLQLARLRAVENGRYVVRAMKTGISAIIDPSGRVVAELPIGVQGVAFGEVAPLTAQTPYVRFGDWIVGVSALLLLLALAFTASDRCRIMQ